MRLSLSRKFNIRKKTTRSRFGAPWELSPRRPGRPANTYCAGTFGISDDQIHELNKAAAHPISRRNACRLDDRASVPSKTTQQQQQKQKPPPCSLRPVLKSFSPALMANEYLFPRAKKRRPVTLFTGSFRACARKCILFT